MSESDGSCDYDVLVIGGGPAGTTVGSMLRTYNPELSVCIVDKEQFPRDHIGESQLPGCSSVCHEIGVWDKVEAANFPIKVGAIYKWGRTREDWNYDFIDPSTVPEQPRPHRYEGVRTRTAFQVDRAVYDKILLDHAAHLGCTVEQGVQMTKVNKDGDWILSMDLSDGRSLRAKHYVDATGAPAVVRRAMGVGSVAPKELRNIAIWKHWDGADWGITLPNHATYIRVLSLPYGWMWFIPISRTRTSVGLVTPVEHYKSTRLSPDDLYAQALRDQETISSLLANATPGPNVKTTNDWSHLSERMCGENWFMVGECCGFADPILSAGMLMAHSSARDCACTINEISQGQLDAQWLRDRYTRKTRKNIWQYIRFAQFWYASNGCFSDIREHCAKIASEGGLTLQPNQAWRWLSEGGFAVEETLQPSAGSFDPLTSKDLLGKFLGQEIRPLIEKYNVFELNTFGAKNDHFGIAHQGRIHKVACLKKGEYTIPLEGTYGNMIQLLQQTNDLRQMIPQIQRMATGSFAQEAQALVHFHMAALDTMIHEGWVQAKVDPNRPMMRDPNW